MSTSAEGVPTPAPQFTPPDRVAPEDASLLWPDAHLLAEPPPGYQPLDMPAPWEPEPVTAAAPPVTPPQPASPPPQPTQPWKYAPYAPTASQPVAPAETPAHTPPPGYVISAHYEETPHPTRRAPAHSLRSFRDLRTGPLEGREFASMKEFAVAAVLEAGYPEADVARLFRFAPWQLRAWVDEARSARFGSGTGTGPA